MKKIFLMLLIFAEALFAQGTKRVQIDTLYILVLKAKNPSAAIYISDSIRLVTSAGVSSGGTGRSAFGVGTILIGKGGGTALDTIPATTSGYFLQAQGTNTKPAYFNLFGTANTWTAAQTTTANFTITKTAPTLTMKDFYGRATPAYQSLIKGTDSTDTTIWYVGDGSASDTVINIYATTGYGLRLYSNNAQRAWFSNSANSVFFGTSTTTGNGNVYAGAYYTGTTIGYTPSAYGAKTASGLYLAASSGGAVTTQLNYANVTINGTTYKILVADP